MSMRRAAFLVATVLWATASAAAERVQPLWEGMARTPQMDEADAKLIAGIREKSNGDLAAGATRALQLGWMGIGQRDFDLAIRRFNQAWLLDPANPAVYWGLAVATHQRGDGLKVSDRWFAEAEKRLPAEPAARMAAFQSDRGRILEQSGKPMEAIPFLEKALALSPAHAEAHVGLARAYMLTGNALKADEHRRALERLPARPITPQ